jgi:ribonuclease R
MNLRASLLALLRAPDYQPGNEYDLAQRLGLGKKHRAMLAHEVRLVLKSGSFVRQQNGRIAPRGTRDEPKRAEARPIFLTAKQRAAAGLPSAAPAPAAPLPSATTKVATPPPSRELLAQPRLGEDELTGRIQFRAGGSAFVVRDDPASLATGEPALQVFAEDTGVALPGDRVLAREFPGRKGRRAGEKSAASSASSNARA